MRLPNMRWFAVACVAVVTLGWSEAASAIGMCEGPKKESTVIGVSTAKKQVAELRVDETCTELDGPHGPGEKRVESWQVRIYNARGKIIKRFKLAHQGDHTKLSYLRTNKFVAIKNALISPNKRCRIDGDADGSSRLWVRRGRRTLYSKNMKTSYGQLAATAYWFSAGKLLVLKLDERINPDHYAETSASSLLVLPARKHRLGSCF